MQAQSGDQKLIKAIGVIGLAATIFNCTVGGGIFRLPGTVFGISGAWTPLVHIVCGVVIFFVGICLARVGRGTVTTGGPYAYVGEVFGPYLAMITGVLIWILGTFSMAAVTTALAASVAKLIPGIPEGAWLMGCMVAIFILVAVVNIRGVKQGALLIEGVSVAKLLPLILLIVVGLTIGFTGGASSNIVWTQFDSGNFTRACMFMIFAYAGVESALVPSGELKNPEKTVPRAIFFGLLAIIALYVSLQIVAQLALGANLATSVQTPLADAAEKLMGKPGKVLLLTGAIVSMFGYMCAMTLAIPRALYAFAVDGLLPKFIARVHPKYHTPTAAIILQVLCVLALALTSTFEAVAIIANLAAVGSYLLCVLAAWKISLKGQTSTWKRVRLSVVPVIALVTMIWLLSSITAKEWLTCLSVLGVASIGYVIKKRKRIFA